MFRLYKKYLFTIPAFAGVLFIYTFSIRTFALTIDSISNNLSQYSNNQIPKYEKLEVTFFVNGMSATKPYLPYVTTTPNGVQAGTGITVNGLLTNPSGRVYTMPAFYYQDFDKQILNNKEWYYPNGNFSWKLRFSPNEAGTWKYKITAQDASGSVQSQEYSFQVVNSTNKGFIRVSTRDPRYFEFEDGTVFTGLGVNGSPYLDENSLIRYSQNNIELVRTWWSQLTIWGSAWNPWQEYSSLAYYVPWSWLTYLKSYPGSDYSMEITRYDNITRCIMTPFGVGNIEPGLKTNTNYRIRVRYFVESLGTKIDSTKPVGFAVKMGGWLWDDANENARCYMPNVGTIIAASFDGSTWRNTPDPQVQGWTTVETTWNSGSNTFLPRLNLGLHNTRDGHIYIDQIWMEQDLGNGNFGPNILPRADMDHHTYPDQLNSYRLDKEVDLAAKHKVYLRPVISEKNDWAWGVIDHSGNFSGWGKEEFFYGNYRTVTKSRFYMMAYWRYLQARYGYSTAIHSWELLNEGDPVSDRHWTLTDELGKYMRQFTPNHHMVSTSFWHSYMRDFWANASGNYGNVDFADLHAYISTSFADTSTREQMTNDTAFYHQWHSDQLSYANVRPNKPIIRGEAGIDTPSVQNPIDLSRDTQSIWLHNYVWAMMYHGGMYEQYWWVNEHIVRNGVFDPQGNFKKYYSFVRNIPLNNGNYQNAAPVFANTSLRAWGQKDLVNNRAHLWIQNSGHTWNNVANGTTIQPITDTIVLTGFSANAVLPIEWWNTYTGTVTSTTTITATSTGEIRLSIFNLTSDVAVKIGNYSTTTVPTPTPTPTPTPPVSVSSADWYMAGANPERSSWVSTEVAGNKTIDWYMPIEAYIPDNVQLIATNNMIYVATSKGLYALDAASGNVRWRYDTELPIGHSPTVIGNTAYFAGFDKKVHAVDALTGASKWEFSNATAPFTSNPVVIDNRVYIGGRDGRFYAIDANNGNLIWQYPPATQQPLAPIKFSPAYKNGTLFFTSLDNYAYALNANDGSLKWKSPRKLRGEHFQGFWPVIFGDQVVFAGNPSYRYLRPGLQSICCNTMGGGSDVYSDYGVLEKEYFRAAGAVNTSTVQTYFREKPYRNVVNILSQTTGAEYDPNGNGFPDDTPYLFMGTKSGTLYPPVVGPNNTLYKSSMNSNGLTSWIPRADVTGWKLGAPDKVSGFMDAAFDEPQALSGGGNLLYRSLCCFRIGDSVNITGGTGGSNYWGYWQDATHPDWLSLERDIPDFDTSWYWYNFNAPGYAGYFKGLNSSIHGMYAAHGNYQNPIIPYNGRLYVHRGNSIIAFGTSNAKTRKPNLTITGKTDTVRVPTTDELKKVLASEIKKIVDAGLLKPGYHTDGHNNDFDSQRFQDMFMNPGETLYTLSAAYPYIDEPLKAQLKAYLDNQYNLYFGTTMYTTIGWKDGVTRSGFPVPEDIASSMTTLDKSTNGDYPAFNIYALWTYAKNVYPTDSAKVTEIYNKAKSKLNTNPGTVSMTITDKAYGLAASYYGFIGLNDMVRQLTNQSTLDATMRTQTQSALSNIQSQIVSGFSTTNPYGDGHMRNLSLARNFINLTPELGSYLNTTTVKDKYQQIVNDANYVAPYWLSAFFESAYQERSESLLQNTLVLQGKAYVLKENREQLYKYIDAGGFEKGDLYYIQNLIATINADGSGTPVCMPSIGDLDNSGKITALDLTAIISYFGSNNIRGDLNCDGKVNSVDITILLSNIGR